MDKTIQSIISGFLGAIAGWSMFGLNDFTPQKKYATILNETKTIIKEAVREYFYPIKWLKIHIWNKLYIRKNEFHKSLEIDHKAMLHMTKKQRKKYLKDIGKRQQIAHEKYLKRSQ